MLGPWWGVASFDGFASVARRKLVAPASPVVLAGNSRASSSIWSSKTHASIRAGFARRARPSYSSFHRNDVLERGGS
jgi:hypothetical protein